ncbi:hypothetical protein [Yersinia ruckeri]|uniref:hypothetical protein n=1 Tax=Yersinia ruckeri TaxID=29486 RepID=UPI0008FE8D3B|nr:hypothetical protein [Yersinia ruckeri]OJB95762.1 hypothetical protein AXW59_07405 [Yersinia ruckeri]OJB98563.1 hypothetical protein AXW58_07385 [Yersinia ruckeri]OJC00211.1 hypothetical protein AXW57_07400 [Yersinia ruckeri]
MAEENTSLVAIDIKPEQAPMIYVPNGLEDYLNHIRELAKEVPDVTTKKGRDRIGSLARLVGVSKKAIENPGRAYLKHLKELVKPAEGELKRFVDECDDISKSILKPRVEWEAEQERLAEDAMWQEAHEMDAAITAERAKKLAEKIAADHEMALLMNDAFDRDAKEKAKEVERLRKAHEEFIAQQAAEKAKREAEMAVQQEREASARREAVLKAQAELAERDRLGAIKQAEEDKRLAEIRRQNAINEAEDRKAAALAQAEREKQEAIAAEQQKAQEAAERIRLEAKQKEDARLAEEKRIADEAEARAANEAHRKTIGTAVVNGLIEHAELTREQAIATLKALINNQIPHTNIHY